MQINSAEARSTIGRLSAARWRVAVGLTAAMMFVYFGFILLVAFDKPLLGTQIVPGVQIVKAVLLLAGAFLLAMLVLVRFNANPLLLFQTAAGQYGASVLAPGRLVSDPWDAVSLGLSLMLGTAGTRRPVCWLGRHRRSC